MTAFKHPTSDSIEALLASSLTECAAEVLNVGSTPIVIEHAIAHAIEPMAIELDEAFESSVRACEEGACEDVAAPGSRPLDLDHPNFDFRRMGHSDVLLSSGDDLFESLTFSNRCVAA